MDIAQPIGVEQFDSATLIFPHASRSTHLLSLQ